MGPQLGKYCGFKCFCASLVVILIACLMVFVPPDHIEYRFTKQQMNELSQQIRQQRADYRLCEEQLLLCRSKYGSRGDTDFDRTSCDACAANCGFHQNAVR